MSRKQNGFTLIEFLIVVAIVGIVLAIAVPSFLRNRYENDPDFAQKKQDRIIKEIRYIRDDRTGLCFAYYWGGSYHGGPALTEVPCDRVSKFLP